MEKVSIIMPCYNDGSYIEEAVQSALNQSYKNIEIIIIDDGSDDDYTIKILEKLEKNPTIHLLSTERVRPAAARNVGIRFSSGSYILPLDSDDVIESSYVEKCVKLLNCRQELGIVYCYADKFGVESGQWELKKFSFENMMLDNVIFATAMFRRCDWETIGGYSESLIHGMEDYDFWLSILELGREVVQIPEILFHYRIKNISRTSEFVNKIDNIKETYQQIYEGHNIFYKRYRCLHAKVLRDAWVEQTFNNLAEFFSCTLFINTGNGFNSSQQIMKSLRKNNHSKSYCVTFHLTDSIESLRFDPIEDILTSIKIVQVQSDAKNICIKNLNATISEGELDHFFHSDPMYGITGEFENATYVSIEFQIIDLEVEQVFNTYKQSSLFLGLGNNIQREEGGISIIQHSNVNGFNTVEFINFPKYLKMVLKKIKFFKKNRRKMN